MAVVSLWWWLIFTNELIFMQCPPSLEFGYTPIVALCGFAAAVLLLLEVHINARLIYIPKTHEDSSG